MESESNTKFNYQISQCVCKNRGADTLMGCLISGRLWVGVPLLLCRCREESMITRAVNVIQIPNQLWISVIRIDSDSFYLPVELDKTNLF